MLAPVVAFLVSVAFWPGLAGAATSPRWAIAAVSLWAMDWRCLPFVAVCFAVLDFDAAVHWAIVSAAFCWGLRHEQISRGVIAASCIGVAVSGGIGCLQLRGWTGIDQIAVPGGLFLNKNILGETAALAFIAAIGARLWPAALLTIPALVLSTSRASWLAVAVGLILGTHGLLRYSLLAAALATGLLLYWAGHSDSASLVQRLFMWGGAASDLRWFGNGSYEAIYPMFREPHLHNDWLQLVYELGIIGLVPVAVVLAAATRSEAVPFVAALVVIGSFGFPLQMPAAAWFAAFVIGHHLRGLSDDRRILLRPRVA